MMKAITGKIIKTTFGEMLVYNEQHEQLAVGDLVDVNGEIRKIQAILPPSKPSAKWSAMLTAQKVQE